MVCLRRPGEALERVKRAMRLDPHYPTLYLAFLGMAYYWAGQPEVAIATLKRALLRNPDFLGAHWHLAVFSSLAGRQDEARAAVAAIKRLHPHCTAEMIRGLPYKDPAIIESWVAALRKAGLE